MLICLPVATLAKHMLSQLSDCTAHSASESDTNHQGCGVGVGVGRNFRWSRSW
jgi:hypothetical protein